jgi:hypothetical protein
MVMLGRRLVSTILLEFPTGYLFSPFGEKGKTYIVARSSSSTIVTGAWFFCHSALLVIAVVCAAGLYHRIAHQGMPFLVTAGIGVIWIAGYFLWAKLVTRGLIENPQHDEGGVA